MHLAIYDLDRTITKSGTFTPFLIFAARRRAPWRIAALPVWIGAMLCHKAGLVARKPLKQFGLLLFVGRTIAEGDAERLAHDYTARTLARNVQPGALARIEQDRREGRALVMATAAPDFYATAIGTALRFDVVIATKHILTPEGAISRRIEGENCYGPHKLTMIKAWLAAAGHSPETKRFYTDHASDAPTLDWADDAFVVNGGKKLNRLAAARNWHCVDFSA